MEIEIREMRRILDELNRKLDTLIRDRDTVGMMLLSQESLKDFLGSEPELYSRKDLKVTYR